MRILHFSYSDGGGGAALASFQLHSALRAAGCASSMLVQRKVSGDCDVERVRTRPMLNALRVLQRSIPRLRAGRRHQLFNDDREPGIHTSDLFLRPVDSVDVVYLHWIARLLSSSLINQVASHFNRPLVWVPMDLEPLTGGCHFAGDCRRFVQQCGACPILQSNDEHDRSRTVWMRKREFLSRLPITFVSSTSWMTKNIRASGLFGSHAIEEIGLAIDTNVFSPVGRDQARQRWGIPQDKKVIFIGSQNLADPRKGMRELAAALQRLAERLASERLAGSSGEEPYLMIVGSRPKVFETLLPFPARFMDQITNRGDLAMAYRCADVYVCPSIDDAGPMMIPETMLCGTPVVAFEMGGAPDLVRDGVTGYLARLGDADDLANGLFRVLTEYPRDLGVRAQAAAYDRHNPAHVAARHIALCERLRGVHPAYVV